ncbi:unnamed protein product [Linum trigynum]|uniref:RNase H type-1 domain-containing protein n=1 Tax=Linum trigynum TaxID=586398 RepID=A0AAV2CFT5_9ROSI
MHCLSPIEAEAKALLEGTLAAVDLNATCLILSYCLGLVKALQGHPKEWPWRAAANLGRILLLTRLFPNIRIDWICRKRNSKADWVARSCARNQLPADWVQILDIVSPLL